jgi:fatty-acyl-CoA synthase
MQGTMMDYQLTLQPILERARQIYPNKQITSKTSAGVHRYTYADFYGRVHKLANVLADLGIKKGDRVATFAFNHYHHLELYFAIPNMGAVMHTLNIRLFEEQLAFVINHAEDKLIFVDASLLPLLERVKDQIGNVEHFIVMSDTGEIPDTPFSPISEYEALLGEANDTYDFPELDENDAAAMCYTSGTTGDPKGVLYSHRALYLHSLASSMADTLAVSENDIVMPVVPMFHANAWGLPFTCTMTGADMVLPGADMSGPALAGLIQDEKVTLAAGVPSLWIPMYAELEQNKYDTSALRGLVVGGSAAPRSMIENYQKNFGIRVIHAWGMTEMSPLGTLASPKSIFTDQPHEVQLDNLARQGMAVATVEMKIVDDGGQDLPWDGKAMGELWVRGPHVAASYYNDESLDDSFTADGWFRTGDVVTIDEEGYMAITDRTKDLVKSGGEWISTVELENALMGHPKVQEAAVIAMAHEKWMERPLAVVVAQPDQADSVDKDELIDFLRPNFQKFWLPDDVVFIEEMPKTSVGKFDKKLLRQDYHDHKPVDG